MIKEIFKIIKKMRVFFFVLTLSIILLFIFKLLKWNDIFNLYLLSYCIYPIFVEFNYHSLPKILKHYKKEHKEKPLDENNFKKVDYIENYIEALVWGLIDSFLIVSLVVIIGFSLFKIGILDNYTSCLNIFIIVLGMLFSIASSIFYIYNKEKES